VYGYTPPRQLEPGATRLRVCASEIEAYVRLHPQLTREEILRVMMSAGPLRASVEAELRRVAASRQESAQAPERPRERS
jgi:hypothetical protein